MHCKNMFDRNVYFEHKEMVNTYQIYNFKVLQLTSSYDNRGDNQVKELFNFDFPVQKDHD